jgi:threonine synthase
VRTPRTIAHSLAIGSPADGNAVLALSRASAGAVVSAPDAEVVAAIRGAAEHEGIFVEPAAGVTLACLARLASDAALRADDLVVAYLTGNGFKTPEVVPAPEDRRLRISPRLADFERAFPQPVEVA